MSDAIQPTTGDDFVPRCSESCPSRTDRGCGFLGHAVQICEPAITIAFAERVVLEETTKKLAHALGACEDITKPCPAGCGLAVLAIRLGLERGGHAIMDEVEPVMPWPPREKGFAYHPPECACHGGRVMCSKNRPPREDEQ